MSTQDVQGLALSGATAAALDPFEQANHELRCLIGDPLASAQRAIELAPQMTLAHALVAWLNLLGTEPGGIDAARAALQAARELPADEREAMHLHAIEQLVAGQWHAAGRTMEDLTIRWPHDTLALQVGHQIDFFTGQSPHAARPHCTCAACVRPACIGRLRNCWPGYIILNLRNGRADPAAARHQRQPHRYIDRHQCKHILWIPDSKTGMILKWNRGGKSSPCCAASAKKTS